MRRLIHPGFLDRPRTRRRFLADLGCAAMSTTTMFSTLVQLGASTAAAAAALPNGAGAAATAVPPDEYRALVCILLAGGNDSFNMLVPAEPDLYAEYGAVRGDLALPETSLIPLVGDFGGGPALAVHPNMDGVAQLYQQGHLAFVANVGTLVERVTLAGLEAGLGKAPVGLYSHNDQIAHWQSSLPDRRSATTGWAGRIGDLLSQGAAVPTVSMNISLSGTNLFQAGNSTIEYAITPDGAPGLFGYGEAEGYGRLKTVAIDGMLNATYKNLFERAYAERMRSSIDAQIAFNDALANAPAVTTAFDGGTLAPSLRMIARTIAAREQLGMKRQTFFVMVGGWDHHDETLSSQAVMLPAVSRALAQFWDALVELGVQRNVTTFTISDFGRTLTSNGKGSDHGWGGNQIVMGGSVAGGRIYGEYPHLYEGNPLDTGRGRLIPTLSVDEYFAELALWLGVEASLLDTVLPNVRRFYTPGSGVAPVGFLADV